MSVWRHAVSDGAGARYARVVASASSVGLSLSLPVADRVLIVSEVVVGELMPEHEHERQLVVDVSELDLGFPFAVRTRAMRLLPTNDGGSDSSAARP